MLNMRFCTLPGTRWPYIPQASTTVGAEEPYYLHIPWGGRSSETPRGSTPLESRRALFDERPNAFPGVLRFTADILRERFKFQGSA